MEFGQKSATKGLVRAFWVYPGAKLEAIDIIYPYLKDHHKIMSPFLGGGSLELNLAWRGHDVIGYDYFDDLANLWTVICTDNIGLAKRFQYYRNTVLEVLDYRDFIEWRNKEKSKLFDKDNPEYENYRNLPPLERACIFYSVLSTSFSGKIRSTASSDYRKKTSTSVDRFHHFSKTRKDFKFGGHMSFADSIPRHPDYFIYADPPYLLADKGNNTLYGVDDHLHLTFPHKQFADLMMTRGDWVISYNNSEEVRKLYPGCVFKECDWMYTIGNLKNSSCKAKITGKRELLIFPPGTRI